MYFYFCYVLCFLNMFLLCYQYYMFPMWSDGIDRLFTQLIEYFSNAKSAGLFVLVDNKAVIHYQWLLSAHYCHMLQVQYLYMYCQIVLYNSMYIFTWRWQAGDKYTSFRSSVAYILYEMVNISEDLEECMQSLILYQYKQLYKFVFAKSLCLMTMTTMWICFVK